MPMEMHDLDYLALITKRLREVDAQLHVRNLEQMSREDLARYRDSLLFACSETRDKLEDDAEDEEEEDTDGQ